MINEVYFEGYTLGAIRETLGRSHHQPTDAVVARQRGEGELVWPGIGARSPLGGRLALPHLDPLAEPRLGTYAAQVAASGPERECS